ncbi:MAG: D-ribose pyranase [Acidaminobacteraceae bacterium]
MKKGKFLNSHITSVIASMGHTDTIVIADAGLPVPGGVKCIDVSLIRGTPSFMQTLNSLKDEIYIESVILAEEIKEKNPDLLKEIKQIYDESMIKYVNHDQFKVFTKESKAIVRTGECSPYANIILSSGVEF